MTLFIVLMSIVAYFAVLAAWVSYWGRKSGLKGYTSHKQGRYMIKEATIAAWGVIWPVFIPAGIVAAPIFGLIWLGDEIAGLFGKSQRQGLAINERKHQMANPSIDTVIAKKPKSLPGDRDHPSDHPIILPTTR